MSTEPAHDDGDRDPRRVRVVNDALDKMHAHRSVYRQSRRRAGVTKDQQAGFQAAVLSVYDELLVSKERAPELWEKHQLDSLPKLDRQTETVRKVDTEGGRVAVFVEERPYRINCEDLVAWSHRLDHVADRLGYKSAKSQKKGKWEV